MMRRTVTSRYSTLGKHMSQKPEMYSGQWMGKSVQFSREFRGHRFSEEECQALCRGELIEVHGLRRSANSPLYGVLGGLVESSFQGTSMTFEELRFKVSDILLHNDSYRFATRTVRYTGSAAPKNSSSVGMQDNPMHRLDAFSDEMESELAAMLAAPELPPVQQVDTVSVATQDGTRKLPIFVPKVVLSEGVELPPVQVVVQQMDQTKPNHGTANTPVLDVMDLDYEGHDVRVEEGLYLTEDELPDDYLDGNYDAFTLEFAQESEEMMVQDMPQSEERPLF